MFSLLICMLFVVSFANAEFGYNNLEKPSLISNVINYTELNVNNSQLLQGLSPTEVAALVDLTGYAQLDGSNQPFTGDIDLGSNSLNQTNFEMYNDGTNQNFDLTSGGFVFNGGNVLIGSGTSVRQLTLDGTTNPRLSIRSNSNTGDGGIFFGDLTTDSAGRIYYNHAGNFMYFGTAATEWLRLLSNGNFGIGTNAPTEKLEVNGNLFLNGDNDKIILGTGKDASITYDGTNMVINPAEVGTGSLKVGDGTNQAVIKADGEINLIGTARVYKNEWITVSGLQAPGTKPADYTDWGINGAYEFNDGTDDTVVTTIRIPSDMDKTVAPEFKIGFASDTNSEDVVWQLEYLYVSPDEDTTAAAQETLTTTQTISSTADGLTIATITGMDLPSSTDQLLMLRIKRLGADGSDTLGDDAYLVGCGLKYVSNKFGTAL